MDNWVGLHNKYAVEVLGDEYGSFVDEDVHMISPFVKLKSI